ncbi:MAG TPA: hypothetical protein PLM53_16485 [Spirochaetota bacterium]|nr:hypothetical protein [Spirochaetota bacterium]HPC42284.1 hypothetical protein [Spirochaetota bacterium]HPL16644.1 hypothetical protein [Spirochaetota bacterium]HQF09990.1 hypothetical protein [Spirochaetota bacterium]HQH98694.1 hypothetical protein [Spirochaetota bacterium]
MRSKSTNVLQGIVLLTGIVYIVVGFSFYVSPYRVFRLFSSNVETRTAESAADYEGRSVKTEEGADLSSEEWLKQIVNDEIISPLYYVFRVFAALLLVSGVAMIMPLFDPLRYRGLVYYNGLIYPFISAISMFLFIRSQKTINTQIAADAGNGAVAWQVGHMVMTSLAILFTLLFILTALGLLITRKQAREGKE